MSTDHTPDDDVPLATHESVLEVSGVKLRCYVLEDGQRVIDCDDVNALFRAWLDGAEVDASETERLAMWVHGRREH